MCVCVCAVHLSTYLKGVSLPEGGASQRGTYTSPLVRIVLYGDPQPRELGIGGQQKGRAAARQDLSSVFISTTHCKNVNKPVEFALSSPLVLARRSDGDRPRYQQTAVATTRNKTRQRDGKRLDLSLEDGE